MSNQVKLQVPIDKDVRDKWATQATRRGFDSLQAYVRFLAKADVEERKVDFGEDDWGEPTDEAATRINKAAEEAKKDINVSRPFYTTEEALKHLHAL